MPRPPNFIPLPKAQPQNVQTTELPSSEAVNFDLGAFDDMLHSQGMTLVHYRALKCPIGVVDPDDERHPHGDHGDCSNGFLYRLAAQVTCGVGGNSDNPNVQDFGVLSQAQMTISVPRYYDIADRNGKAWPALMAPYDRLYLAEPDITVPTWQEFECCGGPTDKLRFPVAYVEEFVDNTGRWLVEGQDFTLEAGLIKWLPAGRQPNPNPDAGTGGVCSIRYHYRPYWYVKSMPHEIRVTQLEDPATGRRRTVRAPQQVVLQREYIFENQANDKEAKENQNQRPVEGIAASLGQTDLRTILGARDGSFGPR